MAATANDSVGGCRAPAHSSMAQDSSPTPAADGEAEPPNMKLRVGGGLSVLIQTSGSPTPSCVTDGSPSATPRCITDGLKSHSTKQLLGCRATSSTPTRWYDGGGSVVRLAQSASQLASDSRMLPVSERRRFVHSPLVRLSTYTEKSTSRIPGASWSPSASVAEINNIKNYREHTPGMVNSTATPQSPKAMPSDTCKHPKNQPHQRSYSFNLGGGETTSLLSREQAPPTTRRRILTDYERDLTFKPKLNTYSLKIASRNSRLSLPVINRLSETRKNDSLPRYDQEHLTFAPKLNPLSLKLAHERASRMSEVHARQAQLAAARLAEAHSNLTFKPQVSERSLRIAQALGTDFLTRQQNHLAKRGKLEASPDKSPTRPHPSHTSKGLIKLTSRALPVAKQPSPHEADSAKAASCSTSPRRSSIMDDARDSCEEAGGGVANKEVVQTTPTKNADGIRPASCTPSATRNETKLKVENSSPNLRTPPQARKCTRNKHVRSRTHPAVFGGENTTTGSSLRKMTGAGGKDSLQESKKVDALMMAKFENLNNSDRVKRIRMTSEKIIKSKRVFLIRGGYHRIRKCLRQRGWIEQDYKNSPLTRSTNDGGNSSPKKGAETACCGASSDVDDDSDGDNDGNDAGAVSDEEYSDEEEYCMMSRAVRNCIPNFVWTLKREGVLYRSLSRDSIANHFAKASSFTTKVGLCTNLRNLLWFGDTDPNTFFPRCYRLSCDEEKEAFIDDYRFTAALCILKMLSQQSSAPHPCVGSSLLVQDSTNAPPTSDDIDREEKQSEEAAQLAMKAAEAFLGSQDHNDIEGSQYQLCPKLSDCEWEKVINHFYTFAFENGQLRTSVYMNSRASHLLHEMEQHYPQLHLDGSRNVWIIKPGALSRGRGIMCMDRLAPILELVSSTIVKNEGKWVIQKYIERPLLIYDTKFDIRQWFLVTDWNPLTMWMYKECYFRFSTQKYTLENLDQSIHLCNNCIQKNYSNSELRADALPEENMWDSDTFQDYLRSSGHPTVWVDTIYPGMKQALIHVLQVAQDEIEHRKNSFELYGADFMITSDYQPWLIEINSSPTMQSSTAVTTRLCRQVMEDTLKVVLDRREDKDCNLGGFELAYKQPRHEVPSYVGVQLCVQGSAIPKPRSYTYMKKTTSNCESACNAENSVYVKQVACDNSKSETVRSSNVIDMYNSSGCGQDHGKKPTSTSNSMSVSTPSTPVKTGQTGLSSCGNRSHPAGVSIVEINCKLPNSNLRVS